MNNSEDLSNSLFLSIKVFFSTRKATNNPLFQRFSPDERKKQNAYFIF